MSPRNLVLAPARNLSASWLRPIRLASSSFPTLSCIRSQASPTPTTRSINKQNTTVQRFSTSQKLARPDKPSAISKRLPGSYAGQTQNQRFREFGVSHNLQPIHSSSSKSTPKRLVTSNTQLDNRVFIVTGGARGLGLTLAEALVEAGGHGELTTFIQ